jgi:hypothetical protein
MGLLKPKLGIQALHITTVTIAVGITIVKFDSAPFGFAMAWLIGETTRHVLYSIWLQRVLGIPTLSTLRRYAEASLLAVLSATAIMMTRGALDLPAPVELLAATSAAILVFGAAWLALPNLTIQREIRDRHLFRIVFGRRPSATS